MVHCSISRPRACYTKPPTLHSLLPLSKMFGKLVAQIPHRNHLKPTQQIQECNRKHSIYKNQGCSRSGVVEVSYLESMASRQAQYAGPTRQRRYKRNNPETLTHNDHNRKRDNNIRQGCEYVGYPPLIWIVSYTVISIRKKSGRWPPAKRVFKIPALSALPALPATETKWFSGRFGEFSCPEPAPACPERLVLIYAYHLSHFMIARIVNQI